jgi:hypothetical protein
MPLVNTTLEGSLTIDAVSMNPASGAWGVVGDGRVGGLLDLWAAFDVRGQDRTLPGATGVIAYPRRMTVTRKDLRLLVVGDVDSVGAPVADAVEGLEANLEVIRSTVLAPVVSSTGTRAAVLTMPSGATRTADIHVLGLVTQQYMLSSVVDGCSQGAIFIGTLQISIPSGRFS